MTHPQTALTSDTIVRQVWGWYTSDGKNALRIFVNRLRRKLGDDSRDPEFVASVRGTGYRFIRNVTQLGDDAEPLADRRRRRRLPAPTDQWSASCARSRTSRWRCNDARHTEAAADQALRLARRERLRRRHGCVPARRGNARTDAARGRTKDVGALDGERRRRHSPHAGVRERPQRAHRRAGAVRRHPPDGAAVQRDRSGAGRLRLPGVPVPPHRLRRPRLGPPRRRPPHPGAVRSHRLRLPPRRVRGVRTQGRGDRLRPSSARR